MPVNCTYKLIQWFITLKVSMRYRNKGSTGNQIYLANPFDIRLNYYSKIVLR